MTDTEGLQSSRLIQMSIMADKQRSGLAKQSEQTKSIRYECGFYAVNNEHCVPDGLEHCVVCNNVFN